MKTHIWPTGTRKNIVCERAQFWLFATQRLYSTWGIITEMQIKTTMRYPSKNLQTIHAAEGVEKRQPCYPIGGNVSWYSHYGEQYGDSLRKWKIDLLHDPAIPLWRIDLEKDENSNSKRYTHHNAYISTIQNS